MLSAGRIARGARRSQGAARVDRRAQRVLCVERMAARTHRAYRVTDAHRTHGGTHVTRVDRRSQRTRAAASNACLAGRGAFSVPHTFPLWCWTNLCMYGIAYYGRIASNTCVCKLVRDSGPLMPTRLPGRPQLRLAGKLDKMLQQWAASLPK